MHSGPNQRYQKPQVTTRQIGGCFGSSHQTNGTTTLNFSYGGADTALGYRSSSSHYYITDHLGSIVGMFSATGTFEGGYSYSPYGEARATGTASAVTANTQRYIGGYLEATNLYKLGARYCDATTGRFTQFDPAGQEANPYSYAGCNPINAKDPTGLSACSYTTAVFNGAAAVTGVLTAGALISAATIIGGVSLGTLATVCVSVSWPRDDGRIWPHLQLAGVLVTV